jgi:VWFA-related protein
MKISIHLIISVFLAFSPLSPILAQNPVQNPVQTPASTTPSPAQSDQQIRISSNEVVLDVVARDKKGRLVTDLVPGDLEVFEDGVRQTVESFKLVNRISDGKAVAGSKTEGAAAPAPKPAESRSDPDTGVSVVALVYDRLSQDGRKRAMDASLDYLSANRELTSFVGVFAVNLSLRPVQNYTTDYDLVRLGIEKAGILASASFEGNSLQSGTVEAESQRNAMSGAMASSAQAAGAAGNSAGAMSAGTAIGALSVDSQFAAMQDRTRETFDALQRDQQGFSTTNGLMAIVNSMRRLPGRKAVLFFSEGVAIPPNVAQHFRSVINAANRANVSIYAIDAAGLRTESPLQSTRDEINARARRRMDNLDKAFRDTSGPLTKGLERNEDLLNLNPQNGLMQLALETGGSFIGDNNRIGPRLQEINQELNSYYLLSYVPTSENYDGKFRAITVKTRRSGIDLVSRKGYYAVGPTGSSPLFYYEALPLAALNRPAPTHDFPILAGSLNYPALNKVGLTAIEVEVPASVFTFVPDNERNVYSTDFSILALIRDQNRQVVDKLSYHYALVGPLNSMGNAKKGKILFYRETSLPPGRYSVEAVAYDALSNRSSVTRHNLELPEMNDDGLRLSSVAVIQRVEQLKDKIESPFRVGDLMLYPNLGEPVRKSAGQMGFYFNVYPAKAPATKEQPTLLLEVLQGSKSVARVPLKLASPDDSGRIPFASALPLASLAPGDYELRVTVTDSSRKITRGAPFTLVQ